MDYEGNMKKQKRSASVGTARNTSSASASTSRGKYDVFLSFSGIDTRKCFTDYLYHDLVKEGIHTFRDAEELHVGELIGPELLNAMKESEISIPIFSKNYASSRWCLGELAQMVECQKIEGQKILPIFYDVEPSDVKHQTGSYEEAFRQHKMNIDEKTIQGWKEALRKVVELKGWELEKETNGHQGKLIKIVCSRVLELKKNNMEAHIPTEAAEVFESRKLISKEIMEALKDDQINMIGLYGMGGVGKTTLVKEVGNRAKDGKLFDEVVMAAVSQTPNLRTIQGEIADMLDLKFDKETVKGRAMQLSEKLKKKKNTLVILDDIWARVNLNDIGVPFGAEHKGCKIVLTSRSQDVCNQMGTQKNFSIAVLSEQEAWNLFRKTVGDSVDSPGLNPLAVDVAKECAGLPLAIVTIARALINKSLFDWRDAANRLRRSILEDVVSSALELSYNHLKGEEEAKSFFLLCSLFPEDSNIAIQNLLKYGMGLGLFQYVDTVDEARNRAHKLANDLKSSCLLLHSSYEDCVKMHDVVRDFAISIASKDKHVFLVRAGPQWKEWPNKDTFEQYTAISLMSDDIHELHDELECPELRILLLRCSHPSLQFPDNFFLRMKNLKVLDMSGMYFLSLPPSLRYLKNLRTLCLDRCSLKDLSLIGELRKLKILSFLGSYITELPKEVGTLTHLRLLDLTECRNLKIIPPDVIRGLSQLEGLYMERSFGEWEIERQYKERSSASLAELKHLSHLTALEINISDANCLPEDLLFKNLSRFKISLGTSFARATRGEYYSYSTILKLKLNLSTPLKDGVNVLLEKVEHLHLMEMEGLKSVLYDLVRPRLQNLGCLIVEKCHEMEYIFNATERVGFPILKKLDLSDLRNLKEICHGQIPARCFCELQELRLSQLPRLIHMWRDPTQQVCFRNLRVVKVVDCDELKNLFSYSIAKDLSKLDELEVGRCNIMEEIFGNDLEATSLCSLICVL